MPRVSNKKPPARLSTEAAFEKKFAAALLRAGIKSHHTAEKFVQGMPDRYVMGGNWVEIKQIAYTGTRKITPSRLFSPAQRLWLDDLHGGGDRAWALVLFQGHGGDPQVILCPWMVLRVAGQMDPVQIAEVSYVCKTMADFDNLIEGRFGTEFNRFSNYKLSFKP